MRHTNLALAALLGTLTVGCGEDLPNQGGAAGMPASAAARKSGTQPAKWPRQILRAEQTWQLNLPHGERFDASGLVLTRQGELLTLNDRGATVYRIQFLPNQSAADLVEIPTCFTPAQLLSMSREKNGRFDCEGVAEDEEGRIYVCEESNRWVLRCDRVKGTVERLPIDWSPVRKYFDAFDLNASFEGIAVANGRLYLANERQLGRIIVVDLKSLRVIDDFTVHASGSNARDVHYSDLSWFDGVLFALLRESRCVLAIDPRDHGVLAEYDFREMEREPDVLYRSLYPTSQMEGLAVDPEFIWLCTDNNGAARARHPDDIRPTLFKCRYQPVRLTPRGTKTAQ